MVGFRIYTVELYWSSTCPNGQIYGLNSGWNGEIYTVELYWSSTFHNGQIYWPSTGQNCQIYTVELYWSSTGQMIKCICWNLVEMVKFTL